MRGIEVPLFIAPVTADEAEAKFVHLIGTKLRTDWIIGIGVVVNELNRLGDLTFHRDGFSDSIFG